MNSFRLQDIKGFRDSGEIELKPITILVGKNSCGKSSLLRFPALLAQTANYYGDNPPVSFFGDYIDYGNFEDVVHGKDNNEITFSLSYNVEINNSLRIVSSLGRLKFFSRGDKDETNIRKATMTVTLKSVNRSIKVKSVALSIEDRPLSNLSWNEEDDSFSMRLYPYNMADVPEDKFYDIKFNKDEISFEKFFPCYEQDPFTVMTRNLGVEISEERQTELDDYIISIYNGTYTADKGGLKLSDGELEATTALKAFIYAVNIMRSVYEIFIAESKTQISYIGPFRQSPGRIYRNSDSSQIHVGSKGEKVSDILARSFQKGEKSSVYNDVSDWLDKYFGYKLEINDIGNNYFQLMLTDKNDIRSNIIDVGFGISQVLPIISEICMMSKVKRKRDIDYGIRNIVLIEQPELHLHPAAQASLAELFADCVTSNKYARLMIETHSEHLISKLQILIADEECPLTNEMVQILYVDKDESGNSFIREMKIKENGKFESKWPEGFFDQGYALSYELMKKSASRDKGKK